MLAARGLILTHLAGNALALWLGYYWLGVGESRIGLLLWSLLVALVAASLFCWLQGASFAYFRESKNTSAPDAFRTALRHLPALLVAAIAICVVYALLAKWADYSATPAFKIASWLTLKLRRPVKPAIVLRVFNVALWLVRWVALPVLLLPMISAIAGRGWRGFAAFGAARGNGWRRAAGPVILLCAVWLPLQLLAWKPLMSGFGVEAVSFAIRAAAAYLLFVAGWLGLARVSADGLRPKGS
jgi:hypothetical protein